MNTKFLILSAIIASCSIEDVFGQYMQPQSDYNYGPPRMIRLPFNPVPPRTQPLRARRDLLSGQISSNPAGGADARLQASTGVGTPDHNLIGTVFAAGNTDKGPVATGGAVNYNLNGHGLSVSKTNIPGVADVLTQNARVNLLSTPEHRFDANVFKTETTLPNKFEFTKTGASIDYSNVNGHGAKFGASSIPNFGTTYELGGKYNLWRSTDHATTLDAFGSASKVSGGPFGGQTNYGGGFGLTHMFG